MSIRIPVLVVAAGSIAGVASAEHFDAYVSIANNKIKLGSADLDEAPPIITPNVRVFPGDLGELPNPAGFGDEPGFYADSLTPGTTIGFNITDALRIWDGTDFNTYAGVGEHMELSKGGDTRQTPASAGGFVSGLEIATADGSGGFDDHPEYELVPNAFNGVVLLSLELWTDAPGVANSDELWIVFNNGADESVHDAAIAWAEANVPSPGVIALAPLAAIAGVRRRR